MPPEPSPEPAVVHFRLRVGTTLLEAEAPVPAGPSRVVDVLPVIQSLGSGIVRAAEEAVVATGAEISCRAGCGACCRQPVPIAESEAVMIAELIASLPEARRAVVERRFDESVATLEQHGLAARMRSISSLPTAEARQALGREYFALGIACPFLENESCSIHASRPVACREYLVTSPAECCADPNPDDIELVPVPVRPSVALFRFDDAKLTDEPRSLVLVLAREWLAEHPAACTERRPGTEIFEAFVRSLGPDET
jgi:Fe-S-cluster containining protein